LTAWVARPQASLAESARTFTRFKPATAVPISIIVDPSPRSAGTAPFREGKTEPLATWEVRHDGLSAGRLAATRSADGHI
jgi:hypothetical protein